MERRGLQGGSPRPNRRDQPEWVVGSPAAETTWVVAGLPGWRLTMVKDEQAIGYEWFGSRSRYEAGRKLLRALQAWDADHG
jgi:hypothetical protein